MGRLALFATLLLLNGCDGPNGPGATTLSALRGTWDATGCKSGPIAPNGCVYYARKPEDQFVTDSGSVTFGQSGEVAWAMHHRHITYGTETAWTDQFTGTYQITEDAGSPRNHWVLVTVPPPGGGAAQTHRFFWNDVIPLLTWWNAQEGPTFTKREP